MGFVDGSWKINTNGLIKTRIGGYIINRMGLVCYLFSCPGTTFGLGTTSNPL